MNLGVDHIKAAVVAIDLHRGHLDMSVATMPTTPDVATRIIAANKRLFDWCRSVAEKPGADGARYRPPVTRTGSVKCSCR